MSDQPTIKSLQERLSEVTEHKAPTAETTNVVWFADDADLETPNPTGNTTEAPKTETQTAQPETNQTQTQGQTNNTGKLPDSVIRQSAETATLMYGQALEVTFTLIANAKLKNRFSDDEKKVIIDKDLEFTEEEKILDEAEKTLAKKWKYYNKKCKRTIADIPLKEDEEKRITDAFYNVFKIKNITLPPEYLLLANLLFTTTDRIVDAVID